ncbi:hypothetical protein [Streptomyces sp. NPDC001933]|uniref:hypothetical protein n=1 Tax=Streptomyces sp. NPDC001933 TaxID=3364626 RepID=UPI0036CA0F80
MKKNAVYGITRMSVADSQAFDCDWGNTGTCTIQYNFSRDNIGGFFLDCDGCGTIGGAKQVIRYNISENDCRMSSVSAGRSALHMPKVPGPGRCRRLPAAHPMAEPRNHLTERH